MERDWEMELESAHALAKSAIRIGEGLLATLAETLPFVKASAEHGIEGAADLAGRIEKALRLRA